MSGGIDLGDIVWGNILDSNGDLIEWSNESSLSVENEISSSWIFIEQPESMIDPFHSNQYFVTIILTHAITFIVGVIGNSVVIGTWARGGKIRSPTTTFLVSLACADLLLLFIFMPLETAEYFVITWDKHGYICKLSSFVELLSGMASILNLVAVSVERYVPNSFFLTKYSHFFHCLLLFARLISNILLSILLSLSLPLPSRVPLTPTLFPSLSAFLSRELS